MFDGDIPIFFKGVLAGEDPQVMTTVAARFAAPWGHHDPKRLRTDLVEAGFGPGWALPWKWSPVH